MKRSILQVTLFFLFAPLSISFSSSMGYFTYKNLEFNYKMKIPHSWQIVDINQGEKHHMSAKKDYAEIKVMAIKVNRSAINSLIHQMKWNLRETDPQVHKIIETKKINIKENMIGKLLVFEYKVNKKQMLHRAIISVNNNITYTLECISPVGNFYQYNEIFVTALASFNYIKANKKSE